MKPLSLPSLPPLQARLLNALITRALPADVVADTGCEPPALCRLEIDGQAAALHHPAPFAPVATLLCLTGDVLWKVEADSLEALALRPELAAWRQAGIDGQTGQTEQAEAFSTLPEALRLAVLARLFSPALERLGLWLGCEIRWTTETAGRTEGGPDWAVPLPLILHLPSGAVVRLRLSWAEDRAARFVMEKLESLSLRHDQHPGFDGTLRAVVKVGSMVLSPTEAASLMPGDVLLPQCWTPDSPRLVLSDGIALVCALHDGILTVQGRDLSSPQEQNPAQTLGQGSEKQDSSPGETAMPETSESPALPDESRPLLDQKTVAALELPVTFELASLRLKVEELAVLAAGHTFALGGDVDSVPVLVRVGGRAAARGRLVDVGGMPGVQITGLVPAEEGEAPETQGN